MTWLNKAALTRAGGGGSPLCGRLDERPSLSIYHSEDSESLSKFLTFCYFSWCPLAL